MTTPLLLRRYRPSDREACLALFEGNVPSSFLPEEVAAFAAFLEEFSDRYLVAFGEAHGPVACGGVALRGDEAILCWGLVDARRHREGIGRVLLRARLAMAARIPGALRVTMNTSQVTAPFFTREGFATIQVRENYFRPGLDRHDLELQLDEAARRAIEARLAATLAEGHEVEAGVIASGC
jgi:GNAT superfamily N-acetyltransferase